MQLPLVSIIVPIHNSEKTLNRCIDSILNQDYQKYLQ
ncbi:glycosyltransferase [Anaerotignum faecicola]|nr:glycosyltransferase [Anaerotignum faecicola]